MKLSDLFERLASPVYVNDSKTLYLVNNLIKKEFGLNTYEGSGGMCFLSQFIFSIASAIDIPEQTIANVFKKKADAVTGHSLKDLLVFFENVKILHSDKIYKLKLSFERYNNLGDVIKAIKSGIPVTFITNASHPLYNQLENLEYNSRFPMEGGHPGLILGFTKTKYTKEKVTKKIEEWERKVFHALLMVGYDSAYKMLIGRESRSKYGYHGYFRIYEKELKANFDQFAFLSIIVDDVEIIDNPSKKPVERFKHGERIAFKGKTGTKVGRIIKLLHQDADGVWGYRITERGEDQFVVANLVKVLKAKEK